MSSEPNLLHLEIVERLSKLDVLMGVVNEKCDGINRRLDLTNGRIAKAEGSINGNEKDILLLQKNDESEKENSKRKQVWVDWAGRGLSSFVITIAIGLAFVVLQKLNVVNVSIVPEPTYKEVNSLTKPYENR